MCLVGARISGTSFHSSMCRQTGGPLPRFVHHAAAGVVADLTHTGDAVQAGSGSGHHPRAKHTGSSGGPGCASGTAAAGGRVRKEGEACSWHLCQL